MAESVGAASGGSGHGRMRGRRRTPGSAPHAAPAASSWTTSVTAVCIGWRAPPERAPSASEREPRRRPCYQGRPLDRHLAPPRSPPPRRRPRPAGDAPTVAAGPRTSEHAVESSETSPASAQHDELSQLDADVEAEQRHGDRPGEQALQIVGEPRAVHQPEHARRTPDGSRPRAARARGRRTRMFSSPVATIVTGIRNSISGVGRRSAPVTASASVIECPTVNAVTTQSSSPPVAAAIDRRQREQEQDVVERRRGP